MNLNSGFSAEASSLVVLHHTRRPVNTNYERVRRIKLDHSLCNMKRKKAYSRVFISIFLVI